MNTTDSILEIDDPELEDAIIEVIKGELASVHTMTPAIVRSYDEAKNRMSVQPVLRGRFVDEDTETIETYLPKPISNIPMRIIGTDEVALYFPVKVNDVVMLHVSERSIAEWKDSTSADITPDDMRRFDLSDAIAYPTRRTISAALHGKRFFGETSALGARFVVGNGKVALGANGVEALNEIKKGLTEAKATITGLITTSSAIATAGATSPAVPVTNATLAAFWASGLSVPVLTPSLAAITTALAALETIRGDL